MTFSRQRGSSLFFILALLFLGQTNVFGGEKDVLATRVTELCQAKKNNQWDIVYNLYSSEYKQTVSKDKFLSKRRGVVFGDCTIEKVTIAPNGQSATVRLKTDANIQGSVIPNSISIQHWLQEDGKWYQQVQDFRSLFAPIPPR